MKLSHWQHATFSLIILVGLIILVALACVRPAISYYEERYYELVSQQERLQRYQSIAAQKEKLTPFFKQQLNSNNDQQHFLPKMAPSLAAAKLQEQVKLLLATYQGQLISTQPVAVKDDGFMIPVMIRVNMKSNIETLVSVLHHLESTQPLVFIDNISIQKMGGRRNKLSNSLDTKPLNTQFNLKVYMLNNETET